MADNSGMELPEQIHTWRGLVYYGTRPLQEAEAEVIAGCIHAHAQHAWIWRTQAAMCLIVVALMLLPIPLYSMGVNAFWLIGIAAILFMGAGILGGLLEVFKPASRVRQTLFSIFLVGCFGAIGIWTPGDAAPRFGKLLSLISLLGLMLGGGALGFLRCVDQWRERAFYLRLKTDLSGGTVWGFGERLVQSEEGDSRFPIAEVLPRSGLVVSLPGQAFPKMEPILPMPAAPRPARTWEIPSQALPPPGLRRATRLLTDSERMEGKTLLANLRRKWIVAAASLPVLIAFLYWAVRALRMDPTPRGETGARLLAVTLPLAFGSVAVKGWRRLSRFEIDLQVGKVEVFRPAEADDQGPPLAEWLPCSRYVWTWQGRLGPIRLSRQKRSINR